MVSKGISPKLITFATLLIFSTIVFAGETGKIAGKITDAKTGEALPGASIVITSVWENGVEIPLKQTIGTSCDLTGYYFIINVRPGTYTLTASYIGYGKAQKTK
ncbi:MAG: carboxypeptidase-like regulatory domain-containing protein, partial [Melioribacteraceae bacterium]